MILDIITAALIIIPMGLGMARGFLYIAVRLLGWIGALAGGFFLMPVLRKLMADGAPGILVHDVLESHFEGATEGVTDATESLPSILAGTIDQTVTNTIELMVNALENLILTVVSFLVIVILIRLLLIFVIRPISKKQGRSPVSFINKIAGLAVGAVEGLLLAFLFLAALVPIMQMSSPETAASIADGLKFSFLAGSLYDGNLLLAIFGR